MRSMQKNQAEQEAGPIELGTGTQFWEHPDYGVVLVVRRVTPHGYLCRITKRERDSKMLFCDAVLPRWELLREITEQEWHDAGAELDRQKEAA
jgi:hypothetical protein